MSKREERDTLCGTMQGFVRDMSIVASYWGVRVLLRKHFLVLEDSERKLLVVTPEGIKFGFYVFMDKKQGAKHYRMECRVITDTEEYVFWSQQKEGIKPFSTAAYDKNILLEKTGITA